MSRHSPVLRSLSFLVVLLPTMLLADPVAPATTLSGHKGRVVAVAFSPDGSRLATASDDGVLKIWDTIAKKEVRNITGITSNENAVSFTPDGKSVVTIGDNSNVLLIDPITGDSKTVASVGDLHGGISAMDLSPDGKTVALVGRGGLRLWDVASGKLTASYDIHPSYGIASVAFSPDGKFIGTASTDHTALVLDIGSGKIVQTLQLGLNGEKAVFSRDGKRLLVFTDDRVLTSFDIASGEGKKLLDNGVPVSTMALSADGKTLILAGTGIAPWSIALPDGTVAEHAYTSDDRVMSAAVSPDGKWVAGGANEGDVYLWPLVH